MGSSIPHVMPAADLSPVTEQPVKKCVNVISQPSIVEQFRHGLEETNEHVLQVMADWYGFLQMLEQNPQNYKEMCRDGDVESVITGLEESGKSLPRETWTAIGKVLRECDADTYEKFEEVDENVRACGALLREVSWTLSLLHLEKTPSTGPTYPIDEVIESLRR